MEISDFEFRAIEIGLAIILGIVLPILYSTWRNTINQAKENTKMKDAIINLEKIVEKEIQHADKIHTRMEDKIDDLCNRVSRHEGQLQK